MNYMLAMHFGFFVPLKYFHIFYGDFGIFNRLYLVSFKLIQVDMGTSSISLHFSADFPLPPEITKSGKNNALVSLGVTLHSVFTQRTIKYGVNDRKDSWCMFYLLVKNLTKNVNGTRAKQQDCNLCISAWCIC